MLPPVPLLTRRAVTAGGLAAGAVLLTGCHSSDAGVTSLTGPAQAVDLPLVRRAWQEEAGMVQRLQHTAKRFQALRHALAPTLAVHREHARLLRGAADGATSTAPGSAAVPGSAAAAAQAVVRAEIALAEHHLTAAMAAQSGPFAQVLASMAAAAAQQGASLPSLLPGKGHRA